MTHIQISVYDNDEILHSQVITNTFKDAFDELSKLEKEMHDAEQDENKVMGYSGYDEYVDKPEVDDYNDE